MDDDIVFVSLLLQRHTAGVTEMKLAHSWRQGMEDAQALGEAMFAVTRDAPGFAVASHIISRFPNPNQDTPNEE